MESLNKSVNKDSMLVTYLRGGAGSPIISPGGDRFSSNYQRNRSGSSRSPLSPLENVKAPMMAEDEVLVMDGVLVSSVVGSGSSSNSSSSSGKSVHKKELCRVWEDLGHCRYAANCQVSLSRTLFYHLQFIVLSFWFFMHITPFLKNKIKKDRWWFLFLIAFSFQHIAPQLVGP